jgi:hypothetical protein
VTGGRRAHLPTVLAIAVVAYAAADVAHELGHALVSLLSGYRIESISTVATQSTESSRPLAAAGTLANLATGAIAWLLFRRGRRFDAAAYFLWLFGCVSAMNVGYLVASAILGSGDWARVIADLPPPFAWRVGMGITGLALYITVIREASLLMLGRVREGLVSAAELESLVVAAYLAGGLTMVAASLFNPIGFGLVLISGVGASFGLTCGLLRVPAVVSRLAGAGKGPVGQPLGPHRGWIAAGVGAGILFIAVLGPGIRF